MPHGLINDITIGSCLEIILHDSKFTSCSKAQKNGVQNYLLENTELQ